LERLKDFGTLADLSGQEAAPTTAITHMATQERQDAKLVNWMKQVSDQEHGTAK